MSESLRISIGFAFLTAVLFLPIFFGYLFFDADAYTYDYPVSVFYSDALRAGERTDINQYYLGGFPSALSPVGNWIDPLNQILLTVAPDGMTANNARVLISVFIGLVLSYLFGRMTGLRREASLLLASAYLLAQTVSGMTAGLINSGSFPVMPALLLIVLMLHRQTNTKKWLLLLLLGMIVCAYGWLSGLVQTVFYSVIFAGCYAVFLDWKQERHMPWITLQRWRTTLLYGCVVAGGMLLALPGLYQTVLLRTHTLRISGFGSGELDGLSLVSALYGLVPNYLTVPFLALGHNIGLYLGALSVILLPVACTALWRDATARFFLGTYGIVFLILIPPLGLLWAMQQLPVFSLFHSTERLLLPGAFFGAYASALALNVIIADVDILRRKAVRWALRLIGFVILCFWFLVAALNIFFYVTPWQSSETQMAWLTKIFLFTRKDISILQTSGDHYLSVFNTALASLEYTFSLWRWEFLLPMILLLVAWLFVWLYARGHVSSKHFAIGVVVIVLVNTGGVYTAQFQNYLPKTLITTPPPVVETILARERDPNEYYVLGFLTGDVAFRNVYAHRSVSSQEEFLIARDFLAANIGMLYGVPKADGYEPYRIARMEYLWRDLIANESLPKASSHAAAVDQKKSELYQQLPFLGSLNITYIVSGYELENIALVELGRYPINDSLSVYLYHNKLARPRVSIPNIVRAVGYWEDEYAALLTDSGAFPITVECDECMHGLYEQRGATLSEMLVQPGVVSARTESSHDVWVIVARALVPGWHAYIDGVEVPIYPASFMVQAVLVPAGSHDVRLEYQGSVLPSAFGGYLIE